MENTNLLMQKTVMIVVKSFVRIVHHLLKLVLNVAENFVRIVLVHFVSYPLGMSAKTVYHKNEG